MMVQNWADVVAGSLQDVLRGVMDYLPNLIGALIVFIVGLIVAAGLGMLVEKIFEALRLDAMLARLGVGPYFERAGMRLRGARFLGQLVNWFFIIVFLLAASDILRLAALSSFLRDVVAFLPNVIIAVLIMLASVVLANFLERIVSASVSSARLAGAPFLGTLAWWSVVVFGFLAALLQLQIVPSIINGLVYGLIGMLALAGGLAFGLGGKDYAAHLLGRLREHTERR